MNALGAEVQEVVCYTRLTSTDRVSALIARLFASLTHTINWRLIFCAALWLTCLILVQHVALFALCADIRRPSALRACGRTELANLQLFVVDLTFWLTDVVAGGFRRVELHVRLAAGARRSRARASLACRVTLPAFVTDLHTDVGNARLDAAVVEEELPSRLFVTRGARRREAFAGETLLVACLANIRSRILDKAVGALSETLVLVQEQVDIDAAACAEGAAGLARQALWITLLTALCGCVVVPIARALLNASVHLEEGLALLNADVEVLRVAGQAHRRLVVRAVFAWIVALGVDGEASDDLVNHVVEGVIDVVEGGHLEGVSLVAGVGCAKT